MNYSYSISHFSWLTQAVAKNIIYHLFQKVSCVSKISDPVINGFSPHEVRIHLHICDYSIIAFGIRVLCVGFSKTSYVRSLYRFRKLFVDKVKTEECVKKRISSKRK